MSQVEKLGIKNVVGLGMVRVIGDGTDHDWDIVITVETDNGWVGVCPVRPPGTIHDDKRFDHLGDREVARLLRDRVIRAMNDGQYPVLVQTERGIERLYAKDFNFQAPTPARFRILHKRNGKHNQPAIAAGK